MSNRLEIQPPLGPEPLVRLSDLDEYRAGLVRYRAGEWDDERWTAYRVRFGIYGQKQPGVQMVRIKVPGGILPIGWIKTIAQANRAFAQGDAHITTRQDIQIYSVPLDSTPDLLEHLYGNGVTTREACGNTLRNMTACALSGVCPRELVDAGEVASRLARSWIRQPLVQHMPRKMKFSVSGCATDCGATSIHDLGFVAIEKDGAKGFRVVGAGGLGGQPMPAVRLLDFAPEEELPVVIEAAARIHQRYSDRKNRNASRIKFLVKRFGEEKFRTLFLEEFERLKGLPQRPWQKLDWRDPKESPEPGSPFGVIEQEDGSRSLVVEVPLGLLSSDQLDRLADIASAAGAREARTTRDQNLVLIGLAEGNVAQAIKDIRAIGLHVAERPHQFPEIISCPGTTTCRIGITNSQNFAHEILDQAASDANAKGIRVNVSGCQNSCGLHHVADIGFHGVAKKIGGRHAPHYQIHFGGNPRAADAVGLAGPTVPARHAPLALKLLRDAYAAEKGTAETVRAWAERLGKAGIEAALSPIQSLPRDAGEVFVDWGEANSFAGPPQARGECAAPFAADDLHATLADDSLIALDRALAVENAERVLASGRAGVRHAARRLLLPLNPPADIGLPELLSKAAASQPGNLDIAAQIDELLKSESEAQSSGEWLAYREAVALFIDSVRQAVESGPDAVAESGTPADTGKLQELVAAL